MAKSFTQQLMLQVLLAASWPYSTYGRPLSIHVYNLAEAPAQTLDGGTKVAAEILSLAGVDAAWVPGQPDAEEAQLSDQHIRSAVQERPARDFLVVRVIRADANRLLPGALGYALPDANFGVHATIFYDRVERLNAPFYVSVATILGCALAHEIGHVLLGSGEHSSAGIMKARWGKADFVAAAMGRFLFTASQGAAIRAGLPARSPSAYVPAQPACHAAAGRYREDQVLDLRRCQDLYNLPRCTALARSN
jgi:hypothetical protein